MKKILFKSLILSVLLTGFMACEDIETINVNPDRAPGAPSAQLLSAAQGYLGWIVDSRLNGQSFLWGEYWAWGPGVSLGNAARYVAETDDHNNYWSRAYFNSLTDLQQLRRSENEPHFQAIGGLLSAYIYQGLVDHFGDIPFTDALKGEIVDGSIFNPTFTDGQQVYQDLITMVDESLALMSQTQTTPVGMEDLVFEGDMDMWKKFGNSLKLRLLMRQSVTGNSGDIGAAVKTLISNGDFLEGSAAEIAYTGASGSENPMFADEESGIGLFYVMSNASYSLLTELDDPRLPLLYSPRADGEVDLPDHIANGVSSPTDVNGYRGVDQGGINELGFGTVRTEFSQPSSNIYGAAVPTVLMSNWETWFLRAEAAARYGTSDDEAAAFSNAITANFNYLGAGGAGDYIAARGYSSEINLEARINQIAVQKWISMNGTQEDEGWIESRRLDREGNRVFTGENGIFQRPPSSALAGRVFPSSWLYPETELSLNTSSPNQRLITDKIFWDN